MKDASAKYAAVTESGGHVQSKENIDLDRDAYCSMYSFYFMLRAAQKFALPWLNDTLVYRSFELNESLLRAMCVKLTNYRPFVQMLCRIDGWETWPEPDMRKWLERLPLSDG